MLLDPRGDMSWHYAVETKMWSLMPHYSCGQSDWSLTAGDDSVMRGRDLIMQLEITLTAAMVKKSETAGKW
jgi:hypothetical protein